MLVIVHNSFSFILYFPIREVGFICFFYAFVIKRSSICTLHLYGKSLFVKFCIWHKNENSMFCIKAKRFFCAFGIMKNYNLHKYVFMHFYLN